MYPTKRLNPLLLLFINITLAFLLLLCGCGKWQKPTTIAYDPTYFPLDTYNKQTNINGFFQDLLLEMAEHEHHQFQILTANWDNLYDTLNTGKANIIFGSMNPYSFHEEKYIFSPLVIATGPVVVMRTADKPRGKLDLTGKEVGVQEGADTTGLQDIQKKSIVRFFENIPDGLQMLQKGDLDAIVISQVAALSYIKDLYVDSLTIASLPLTKEGLRFLALKKNKKDAEIFFENIEKIQNSGKMQTLLKKWNLSTN